MAGLRYDTSTRFAVLSEFRHVVIAVFAALKADGLITPELP